MSEFDIPGLRWVALFPARLAIMVAAWAVIVLLLGDQLGANGMAIYFTANLKTAFGATASATAANMYGHLSTANSGPFYLLVAPFLFLLAHRFHIAAAIAFIRLEERGILRTSGVPWHQIIRRRNRRVGLVALLLFPGILAVCFTKQFASLKESAAGLPLKTCDRIVSPDLDKRLTNVGYVQSPNHQRWVDGFNTITSQKDRLLVIEAQEVSVSESLRLSLFQDLDRKNLLTDGALHPFLDHSGGKAVSLRMKEAIDGLEPIVAFSAVNVWAKEPCIHFGRLSSYFESVVKERAFDDSMRSRYLTWFKVFIVLDQIRIAAMFTFMGWLLAKFAFYLVQLYQILPDGPGVENGKEIFLKPWARDGQRKFGLGDLFQPYNLLVLCIGTGSLYFALNFPDGGGLKAITGASGAGSGESRIAHLVVIGLAIACMLVGPLWAYPARLKKWLEGTRLNSLRARQAQTRVKFKKKPSEAEKEWVEITKEEEEILSQTTWPKGDKMFQFSVAVIFTVLLLPLGTANDFLPGTVEKYARLPQYLRVKCKDFAAWAYDLYPPEKPSS